MQKRRLCAFTVVELLVVIAVIGILMALILPAVLAAKEAARKLECLTRLHNLGHATIAFAQAQGKLPPLREFPKAPFAPPDHWDDADAERNYTSWVHALLPHLEQGNISDEIARRVRANPSDPNVADVKYDLKILICGSDAIDAPVARLSYAANGGRPNATSPGTAGSYDVAANGVFADRLKGRLDTHRVYDMRLGDIKDGSTNTIAFAENVDLISWNRCAAEWEVAILWQPQLPPAIGLNQNAGKGMLSADHARPSSRHHGVFNVATCDGSSKSISNSIDYRVYALLMTSNGAKARTPGVSGEATPVPAWQDGVLDDGAY